MTKALHHVGKRIQQQKLHSSELGVLLALCNTFLIVAFLLLIAASYTVLPTWLYLLIALPVALTAFWLWFTQELLSHYKRFSLHDSLLIALFGAIPFFFLLLISGIGFAGNAINTSASIWGLISYFGLIVGTSSVILALVVVMFGLQHHFMHLGKKN